MTHRAIIESWARVIRCAIELGEGDAAYRLTVGFLRRLDELRLRP